MAGPLADRSLAEERHDGPKGRLHRVQGAFHCLKRCLSAHNSAGCAFWKVVLAWEASFP